MEVGGDFGPSGQRACSRRMKSPSFRGFGHVWSRNEAVESELEAWFGYGGWRT